MGGQIYDLAGCYFLLSDSITSVSFRYLSSDIPERKNTPPKMVKAQGLNPVLRLPKSPITPVTKAIAPPITIMIANILIIILKYWL